MTPLDYAWIAQEAYDVTPDIGLASSASRAIVRETEAGLVVAFPGSNNLESWLTDFDVLTTGSTIGEVHHGFWEAWSAIRTDVLAAVDGRPVTLVGHSLGGALAIVAAADMAVSKILPVSVYGFEPPRVSPSAALGQLLKSVPVWLCKNGTDPVPDVPLGWPTVVPLTLIGQKTLLPDVDDHMLGEVIKVLSGLYPNPLGTPPK